MLPLHTCAWSNSGLIESCSVRQKLLSLLTINLNEGARDNEIGLANRDNVHQFLSSLAVYPFSMWL
jgi:hypothetical protein